MACLVVSRIDLQACVRLALPCGVAASLCHDSRVCANEVFHCARAASGTCAGRLSKHFSYFARKSSHSSMPIFSPAGAVFAAAVAGALAAGAAGAVVVVVVVVAVVLPLPVLTVAFVLSGAAQALRMSAKAAQS